MTRMLVKEKKDNRALQANNTSQSKEVTAFCPRCKAFQTVWLNGNALMLTRKFMQVGSYIYHNCGSRQPCRLYFGA